MDEVPTPEQMAQYLHDLGLPEDDVLDILREAGERFGWTKELNETGLRYLKPDAPEGEAQSA